MTRSDTLGYDPNAPLQVAGSLSVCFSAFRLTSEGGLDPEMSHVEKTNVRKWTNRLSEN